MATLTANITSSASQFTVTGDVSGALTRMDYRIDDEIIVLRKFVRELFGVPNPWGQINRSKWVVSRGHAGTTPASHLAGAEIVGIEDAVTTGTTLDTPEPFVDTTGGVQTIRRIGPFEAGFADLNNGGVVLTPIDEGTIVLRVWGFALEMLDQNIGVGGGQVYVESPLVGGAALVFSDTYFQADSRAEVTPPYQLRIVEAAGPDYNLVAYASAGSAFGAGLLQFYALIAEPSV